ncbi:MAG: 50S ribosomal protein L6 [Erysipelotrichaceae bacterium]
MSRIGNKTITIPGDVEVSIDASNEVSVKGPKGTLSQKFSPLIKIENNEGTINCSRANEEKHTKQLHGTTRALINNMIIGVSEGYKIELEIVGIGYRAAIEGKNLRLGVGYSHPVLIPIEEGISVACPSTTEVVVEGIDKQRVGEFAANVRAVRRPEPYKGKGIRYKGEYVRRKEGKTAA